MGHKLSSQTRKWTADDWAYGTGESAIQLHEIIDGTKIIPTEYFGGDTVQNDPSMLQMQRDLLAFDDKLKRILFRRKKNKKAPSLEEQQEEEYCYYVQHKYSYYDRNHDTIPEEDEDQLSQYSNDDNNKSSS